MTRKNLACYDVDDTLFFANQLIGMEVDGVFDWHTQETYHLHDVADSLPDVLDFSRLFNSEDWYSKLDPNHIVIEQAMRDLADPYTDVVIMTARRMMDDVDLFKQGFHDHGMDVTHIEFIFAGYGDAIDGKIPSHAKKAPHFERLFSKQYDQISVYDDNLSVLNRAMQISWDFPFTSFRFYHVGPGGSINTFTG